MSKYICWAHKTKRDKNGQTTTMTYHYAGYVDLHMFGISPILVEKVEDAKVFDSEEALKTELKKAHLSLNNYTIDKIED